MHRWALAGLCLVVVVQAVGQLFSPIFGDEIPILRNVLHFADQRTLVPLQFNYPTLFSYLLGAWVAVVAGTRWVLTGQHPVDFAFGMAWSIGGTMEPGPELLALRLLAVLLTVLLIVATYRLGREAWGWQIGLGAAFVVAASRTLVERSAWLLPDVLAALLVTIAAILSVRHLRVAARSDRTLTRGLLGAAALAGCAAAAKYNGGLAVVAVVTAWLAAAVARGAPVRTALPTLVRQAAWLGVVAMIAFVLCLPALLVAAPEYLTKFQWEARHMQEGQLLADLGEYAYFWIPIRLVQVEQGLGVLLLLFVPAVVALHKERTTWVLGAPALIGILVIGAWRYTSVHYLLWALPMVAVVTVQGLRQIPIRGRWAAVLPLALILLGALPAMRGSLRSTRAAFRTPGNQVQAERWVEATIPAGSRVDLDWYAVPTLWNEGARAPFAALLALYPDLLAGRRAALDRKPIYVGNLGFRPEPPSAAVLRSAEPEWVVTSSKTEPWSADPLAAYRSEHLRELHRRLYGYYLELRSGGRYAMAREFRDGAGPVITVFRRTSAPQDGGALPDSLTTQ